MNQPNSSDQNTVEEVGVGESIQGLIPFRPQTTYGIEAQAKPFSGNLILSGSMQVPELPLAVDGYEIAGVTKQTDPTFYSLGVVPGLSPWLQMGINGNLSLAYKFLKLVNVGKIAVFSFKLGSASAAVQTVNSVRQAYFSGILQPDTSWIPDWMPFKPEDVEHAYGFISSQLSDFKLHIDGRFAVDASEFGKDIGTPLGDVFESEGSMNIDQNGYLQTGETTNDLGPLGASDRQTEVWVPFEGIGNGYISTSGLLRLSNVLLIQGEAKISPATGFAIQGKFANTSLDISVNAQVGRAQDGSLFTQGTVSIPPQFQSGFNSTIQAAAAAARQSVSQQYDAFQQATQNFQFELSLRGMRTLIPPLCNTVNSQIDSGIDSAFDKWPQVLGVDIPGKSAAKSDAESQAAPYKQRMTTLKSAVLQPDSSAARSALKVALQDVLNHPHLTIKVGILGAVYDRDILSASQKSMLQTAINAVDALPDASNKLIQAQQIWDAAPKQDVLQAVSDAIQSGAAEAPRIVAVGFNQFLVASPFLVYADITYRGKTTRVTVPFDPSHPEAIASLAAVAFASAISTQPLAAPPAGASGPLPVIAVGGVVNGAGYQAAVSPGSWVAIFGSNLAPNTRTWTSDEIQRGVLPTQLDGVSVTINGKPAVVYYISPTQIDALAPADTASGPVQVWVTNKAGSSVPAFIQMGPLSPAFFASRDASGNAFALATFSDFRLVGSPPAKPGDVIILWGTGFGPTDPPATSIVLADQLRNLTVLPTITIGGVAAAYVGGALSPGLAGVYQIAVRVPDVPGGNQQAIATSNGVSSPSNVYLSVQR